MLLASTSATIEVKLGQAKTTNDCPIVASYTDNTSVTYTPGTNGINTNGTTAVTAVGSPASSTQRYVKSLHVYNADTTQIFVIVTYFDGSTRYDIQRAALNPQDTLVFTSESGWYIIDTYGVLRTDISSGYMSTQIRIPPGYIPTTTSGTTKTLTSAATFARYLGKAERDYSSVKVVWRVRVLAATINWAEIAIGTGAFVQAGGATITRLGSAVDISGVINSTGVKLTTISGLSGKFGDSMWLLIGNNASTPGQVQADKDADFLTNGWLQLLGSTRPSTMSGGTAFNLEGASIRGIACAFQLF